MSNFTSVDPHFMQQSAITLSSVADSFGVSIDGGRSSGGRSIKRIQSTPLKRSLLLSKSLVNNMLSNFTSVDPHFMQQSAITLSSAADSFGVSINGGRGGKSLRESQKIHTSTEFLNQQELLQIPGLPPKSHLRNQNSLVWDDNSIARLRFCSSFVPQVPLICMVRFVYADGDDTMTRRINTQLMNLRKRTREEN